MKLLSILLFIFFSHISLSQQTYNIKGKVIDENGHPFPNVNIFLPASKTGTITNSNGLFSLSFSEDEKHLSVSFIGYETQYVKIHKSTEFINIQLKPSPFQLDEVVISNISAVELLKRAIGRIPENYPLEPFLSKAYYRAKISERDTLRYMEETSFNIIKSYKSGFRDKYFLVKNRNFELKENTTLRHIGQYDMVQRAENTFDRSFFRINNVKYLPSTTFDNRVVYVLSIIPKQIKDERESRIFIDAEDLAFVRFELKMRSGDEIIAQYKKSDGKYYLINGYSMHINRRPGREFPAESDMIVTDIIYPFSKEDIEGIHVNRKDILKVYATQEQDTVFWSKHNAILADTAIQQALLDFQQSKVEIEPVEIDPLQNQAFLKRLYEPNLSLIYSTDLNKDFISLNQNSVSTSHIINHLVTDRYNRYGIAVSYLYHMLSIPLEETLSEQRLMALDGLKPKMNPTILNRTNSSYIYGLDDDVFSNYKINQYNNFMRLHTIRNDGHFVKAQILEEELARIDLSNRNNEVTFINVYLMELYLHKIFNTYNPFAKDKKQLSTSGAKQPLLVDRNRSWVKYLFNPDAEYQRHIGNADLSEEERKYLKRSSYWSWLNLVSPQMYGIPKFRLSERNSFTFSFNYLRTPFGEQFGQNIWVMQNYNRLHGIFLKQYRNFEKTSLGIGYKLYDLRLFNNAYVTTSIDIWRQPADFQFVATSSFDGFQIGQIYEYQLLLDRYTRKNIFSIILGYNYKTKGYTPESFFLNNN